MLQANNSWASFCEKSKVIAIFRDYSLDAATSSGILKAKQKLGKTFNSDKLGGIDFTKSTMQSA